eukprot:scaffold1403_cov381-Prasinococcus_capsulatus_cf.AAC.9
MVLLSTRLPRRLGRAKSDTAQLPPGSTQAWIGSERTPAIVPTGPMRDTMLAFGVATVGTLVGTVRSPGARPAVS